MAAYRLLETPFDPSCNTLQPGKLPHGESRKTAATVYRRNPICQYAERGSARGTQGKRM